jgi:hypothetical protein
MVNIMEHHSMPAVTSFPKHNPLTANYISTTKNITKKNTQNNFDISKPTEFCLTENESAENNDQNCSQKSSKFNFPLGYVFASNTISDLQKSLILEEHDNSTVNSIPLGRRVEKGQKKYEKEITKTTKTVIPVRDVVFAQDDIISIPSLLNRANNYILKPKMSILMHYSSVRSIQPKCVENPTKGVIQFYFFRKIGELLVEKKIGSNSQNDQNVDPNSVMNHKKAQELNLIDRINDINNGIIHKGQYLSNYDENIDPQNINQQQKNNISIYDQHNERNLLRKLPIPPGSQIILLKQEALLALTIQQTAQLRHLLDFLSKKSTQKINIFSKKKVAITTLRLKKSNFRLINLAIFSNDMFNDQPRVLSQSTRSSLLTSRLLNTTPNQHLIIKSPLIPFLPQFSISDSQFFIKISTDFHISPLLPNLFKFISNSISTLQPIEHTLTQLRVIYTLLFNPHINLEPYITQILGLLVTLLVSKQITIQNNNFSQNNHQNNSNNQTDFNLSQNLGNNSAQLTPSNYLRGTGVNNHNNTHNRGYNMYFLTTKKINFDIDFSGKKFENGLNFDSKNPSPKENKINIKKHEKLINSTKSTFSTTRLNKTYSEVHIRNLTAIILHIIIKQFSAIYPAISTRINKMIFTLLSNFQTKYLPRIDFNTNSTGVNIIQSRLTMNPIGLGYPLAQASQFNAFGLTNNESNNPDNNGNDDDNNYGDEDEVDLISSTINAVTEQRLQYGNQHLFDFNQINHITTQRSLLHPPPHSNTLQLSQIPFNSTLPQTISHFSTSISPISHFSALNFVFSLPFSTIFEQFSVTFPTIFTYYNELVYVPLPSLSLPMVPNDVIMTNLIANAAKEVEVWKGRNGWQNNHNNDRISQQSDRNNQNNRNNPNNRNNDENVENNNYYYFNYHIVPPQRTFTTLYNVILDVSKLTLSDGGSFGNNLNNTNQNNQNNNFSLFQNNQNSHNNPNTHQNTPFLTNNMIQHYQYSILTLQLIHNMIKTLIFFNFWSDFETFSTKKFFFMVKKEQEMINYQWIQSQRNVNNLRLNCQIGNTDNIDDLNDKTGKTEKTEKTEKKTRKFTLFPSKQPSIFTRSTSITHRVPYENEFIPIDGSHRGADNVKSAFEDNHDGEDDRTMGDISNNISSTDLCPNMIMNTTQSMHTRAHFDQKETGFGQFGGNLLLGGDISRCSGLKLIALIDNLAVLPQCFDECIPSPFTQPF